MDQVRYWYDWEFLENGRTIDPISVGIVAEDGREYYAVAAEVESDEKLHERVQHHRWLMGNVVPHLPLRSQVEHTYGDNAAPFGRFHLDLTDTSVKPLWVIANEVREFLLAGTPDVELWAWYGAYDHVRLAQLWGPMASLPTGIPMWTNDLRQEIHRLGIGEEEVEAAVPQAGDAHRALDDARTLRDRWAWVVGDTTKEDQT